MIHAEAGGQYLYLRAETDAEEEFLSKLRTWWREQDR